MNDQDRWRDVGEHLELHKRFLKTLGLALEQEWGSHEGSDLSRSLQPISQDLPRFPLERQDLEMSVKGPLAKVLGLDFASLDQRVHRLRLPAPPFLFMSRVLRLEGKKLGLGTGLIEWDYTIPEHTCFEIDGQISPALLVESGHSVVLLLSYLGYDHVLGEKGRFRALSNSTTFHGGAIRVGSRYRAMTTIEKVFKTKDHVIFHLKTEGFLGDRPVLSSTWQAGVIHGDFLAQKQDKKLLKSLPEIPPSTVEPKPIPSVLHLIKHIKHYDPEGGPQGLGDIWVTVNLSPFKWALDCHFVHDPVYPGILAIEAAFQTIMYLAQEKSLVTDLGEVQFAPGLHPLSTRFVAEIRPDHQNLLLRLSLTGLDQTAEPHLVADAWIYSDGHLLGEAKGLSLRVLPKEAKSKAVPVLRASPSKHDPETPYPDPGAPIPIDHEHVKQVTARLEDLATSYVVVQNHHQIALALPGYEEKSWRKVGDVPPCRPEDFGSAEFRALFGLKYAYMVGAMAHGISSEEMVIAAARAGFLASFGAAGLSVQRVASAVERIQREVGTASFAVNFIHNPLEPEQEWALAKTLIDSGVHLIEASAYVRPSKALIYYRAKGLKKAANGRVTIGHRVIAKISRPEVASAFLSPPPSVLLESLVRDGHLTSEMAELAKTVPLVDALTIESDSGGHTDNRPMTILFSTIARLQKAMIKEGSLKKSIPIGVAGGIGTPESLLAAFAMGGDYVVTGSINQASLEAGTSQAVKKALAEAGIADTAMAPSADMFELGAKVQVLKRKNLFALRAQKLHQFYTRYQSIDEVAHAEPRELEMIFKAPIHQIWQETQDFWQRRNPRQLSAAAQDPKVKMALIFRWYLGMSVHWALTAQEGREEDYQIWCGPAMGALNHWLRGTPLESHTTRRVHTLGLHLLRAAAFKQRLLNLKKAGAEDRGDFDYSFGEVET